MHRLKLMFYNRKVEQTKAIKVIIINKYLNIPYIQI